MKDELARNMKELHYEGFERPFYISYSIDDVSQTEIAATMGALLRTDQNRNRTKNVRVLVGDYAFNDESLDNNTLSPPEANEIQLPLDDDYFGIRRSLWVTTDYVYKAAARQYKKNLETLQEKNKTISELEHRSFASQPVVNIREATPYANAEVSSLEKYIKNVSGIFSGYPEIDYSSAYLTFANGSSYFVNSEGTTSKTPVIQTSLHIFAQRNTEEGEGIHDQIVIHTYSPRELPPFEDLKPVVVKFINDLLAEPAKVLEEEYSGPVLIIGQPVAHTFARTFFFSRESLMASDVLPDPKGYRQQDQSFAMDLKIGKQIVAEGLTMKVKPTMKEFDGVALVGSYTIDPEGVVPKDELTLIDRGVLRNLINDRSLIKPGEMATGHASGPGVVEISMNNGTNINLPKLREQLLTEARKQGLDYAMIIDQVSIDPLAGSALIRVSTKDNSETRVRSGILQPLNLKDLRSIIGATTTLKAHNHTGGNQQITSYIVPEGILLKDVDITKADIRIFKQERFISSPLKP